MLGLAGEIRSQACGRVNYAGLQLSCWGICPHPAQPGEQEPVQHICSFTPQPLGFSG